MHFYLIMCKIPNLAGKMYCIIYNYVSFIYTDLIQILFRVLAH